MCVVVLVRLIGLIGTRKHVCLSVRTHLAVGNGLDNLPRLRVPHAQEAVEAARDKPMVFVEGWGRGSRVQEGGGRASARDTHTRYWLDAYRVPSSLKLTQRMAAECPL